MRTTAIGEVTGHALPALVPTILATLLVEKNIKKRVFLSLLLMLNFGFLVTTGRRQVIFSVLVALTMYFVIDKRALLAFSLKNIKRNLKLIMILALTGSLVVGASLCFYAMRVAGWQLGELNGNQVSLVARFKLGIHIIEQPRGTGFYQKAKNESAVRPATLIGYIAALETAPQQNHMNGQCMLQNVLQDIPTQIWPGKNYYVNVVIPCQDENVNVGFGLPLVDSPGTAQSFGYADFGLLGLLTYPLLCAIGVGLLLNIFMRARLLAFKVFTFSAVAFYAVFAETTITAYLDGFRAIAVIYLCVFGYELLVFGFGGRLAKQPVPYIPIVPLAREG